MHLIQNSSRLLPDRVFLVGVLLLLAVASFFVSLSRSFHFLYTVHLHTEINKEQYNSKNMHKTQKRMTVKI